ncbi:MAG: hypothetical protein IKU80_02820, partial [Firmicutes bacterium]|nr:hypothetical protein [Bacillota bacterium]
MGPWYKRLLEILKSRLFIMLAGIFVLFAIITVRLFSLQIVYGEEYLQDSKASIMQNLSIPASRGIVYDKYGRPLATNQVAFSVKFDDSIKITLEDKTGQIENLVSLYGSNYGAIIDTLPFTSSSPLDFKFETEEDETKWKQQIGLSKKQLSYDAQQCYEYLLEKYGFADSTLSDKEKRKAISLAMEISDKNLLILNLIQLLDENGESIADELPISSTQ